MKKTVLFSVLCALSTQSFAVPMRDVPIELEGYHTDRYPQFLIDFYHAFKDTIKELKHHIFQIPTVLYDALIGQKPHTQEIAYVRYTEDDDIGQEEKLFLEKRLSLVKNELEKMFGMPLEHDRLPRIGFIFSGGGFRAMLMTLGFLHGTQQTGLFNISCYCTGLSGSTWAVAPWIASNKTLPEYMHTITNKLCSGVDHINDPYEISELGELIITKLLCRQFISTMDIYGGVIANTLLKGFAPKPMLVTLSDSHACIQNGIMPLPIYTAIQTNLDPYEWMEFTPFEIGSSYLKSYIPTWAYGRKFKNGSSTNFAPEQTLGHFLGIFGSAFELSLKDVIRMSAANLSYYHHQLPEFIAKALEKCVQLIVDSCLGDARPFPSMLANFTYQHAQSPIADHKKIVLVDAGLDFNLPFPPLLRPSRQLDLLIVYDASATVQGAPELRRAELYAKRHGLKFPPIDYEKADKQIASIFKDPNDDSVPTIIYFPRIKNINYAPDFDPDACTQSSYCNTFNFSYAPEQAGLLCGFAEFCVKEQQHVIKQTVQDILIQKYKYNMPRESEENYSEAAITA